VVRGDLADRESIRRALHDCSGVFGVTDFYEHFDREYRLGVNLVDAVADSEVRCIAGLLFRASLRPVHRACTT
jgi:hypothetical protein